MSEPHRYREVVSRHPLVAICVAMGGAAAAMAIASSVGAAPVAVALAPIAGGMFFGWLGGQARNAHGRTVSRSVLVLLVIFGALLALMVAGILLTAGHVGPRR